jgi:hypothetical protein
MWPEPFPGNHLKAVVYTDAGVHSDILPPANKKDESAYPPRQANGANKRNLPAVHVQ